MSSQILKVMSSKNLSFVADTLDNILKNNVELRVKSDRKTEPTDSRKQIVKSVKNITLGQQKLTEDKRRRRCG